MPKNFSKNELFIFISIIRQHFKAYLHENNQKQIIQKHSKKESRRYASIDLLHFSEKKLLKAIYNSVGAGTHKVGKMVIIPIFCECEKDKSYISYILLKNVALDAFKKI